MKFKAVPDWNLEGTKNTMEEMRVEMGGNYRWRAISWFSW
jgi:hypothetical protein